MELGSEALPHLIAYARETLIPQMEKLDTELTSEEDLKFVTDYLGFTDFVRVMITTDEDMGRFEELLSDPDPQVQRFAQDILEGLEPSLEE